MSSNNQSTDGTVVEPSAFGPLLDELSIPGATGPVPTGEWGINVAAARDNFPEKGLQVYVPAWSTMGRGDTVRILLGDDEVDRKTITEGLEGQRQILFVPFVNLRNGSATLTYKVKRLGQVEESAAVTDIFVKLDRPGGQDQNGEQPGHSELTFSLPEDVTRDGVDKERAAKGVEVIIKPYPSMAEHDRIRVTWGGQFVYHTVTAGEVGTDIPILVDESVILAAGDSSEGKLAVAFEVTDLVDNRSEDWSAEERVVVDTGSARLDAAIVKEARSNVLDLDALNDANVTLQVWAGGEPFAVGDTVVAHLLGETEDGRAVDLTYRPELIEGVPQVVEISVPNADVRQLAKTQARFSYELVKSEAARAAISVDDPQRYSRELAEGVYKSKGQFVNIVGEAVRLAAPVAIDAEQGTLDPDRSTTTVEVPWDNAMQESDVITLVWEGKRPDFTDYYPDIDPHHITRGEAEFKQAFQFTVDGLHLRAIEGGTLVLLYVLERDHQSPQRSNRSGILSVGEPRAELKAPSVSHAENGVLDPAKVPVAGTKLVVESYARIAVDDELFFSWEGKDAESSLEDSIRITHSNVDRPSFDLTISRVLVNANDGHEVVASYWVDRAGGGQSRSDLLKLQVGAPVGELPAPSVPHIEDGVLDPDKVPAQGTTLVVKTYAGIKLGDWLSFSWRGQDDASSLVQSIKIDADNIGLPQFELAISKALVNANDGHEVVASYSVERAS
ncbi:hypothetical protein [Pseudomonas shirazensis]|uniref:hypothetical protein n=1 Tax=Pseudomonas shirazensis TaxID=2745494 RepID=UPI003D2C4582